MRLLFLDDDRAVLEDGLAELDTSAYQVQKALTIEDAQSALCESDGAVTADDVVVFVDHDLGAGREGYEFVEWVRRRHPKGHLLPIVYLTGRESERGFVKRQSQRPFHTPSLYLNKREIARPSFDLNQFVADLVNEFRANLDEVEAQRLQATLRFFESLPDELDGESE